MIVRSHLTFVTETPITLKAWRSICVCKNTVLKRPFWFCFLIVTDPHGMRASHVSCRCVVLGQTNFWPPDHCLSHGHATNHIGTEKGRNSMGQGNRGGEMVLRQLWLIGLLLILHPAPVTEQLHVIELIGTQIFPVLYFWPVFRRSFCSAKDEDFYKELI